MNSPLILEVVPCSVCAQDVIIAFGYNVWGKWICYNCFLAIGPYNNQKEFEVARAKLADQLLFDAAWEALR